jgi:hypothetical protein
MRRHHLPAERFGSAMNLNLHFHTLALEGAFVYEPNPTEGPRSSSWHDPMATTSRVYSWAPRDA